MSHLSYFSDMFHNLGSLSIKLDKALNTMVRSYRTSVPVDDKEEAREKLLSFLSLLLEDEVFPGNSIYFYTDSHPADAYRMDVILAMLGYLGLSEENIGKAWLEYATIFQRDKSFLYEHFFPSELTKRIAQHVYEICNDIGLLPCTENLQKENTLISKFNHAWGIFRGELKPNPSKKGEGS